MAPRIGHPIASSKKISAPYLLSGTKALCTKGLNPKKCVYSKKSASMKKSLIPALATLAPAFSASLIKICFSKTSPSSTPSPTSLPSPVPTSPSLPFLLLTSSYFLFVFILLFLLLYFDRYRILPKFPGSESRNSHRAIEIFVFFDFSLKILKFPQSRNPEVSLKFILFFSKNSTTNIAYLNYILPKHVSKYANLSIHICRRRC